MKPIRTLTLFFTLTLFSFQYSNAQIAVGNVSVGQVEFTAFTLTQPDKIKISGTGGIYADEWRLIVFYGWIIDSQTRKVVWHQIDKMDKVKDLDFGEFPFNDEVALNKGSYELYYTGSYVQRENNWNSDDFFSNFFGSKTKNDFTSNLPTNFFASRSRVKFRTSLQEGLEISVSGQNVIKANAQQLFNAKISDAVASINKPGHDANVKKGFSLSANTNLLVYAIGEGRQDEQFDYAWIYDLDKHKRVWEMSYRNTDFAGGDKKNWKVGETISLSAGNYLLTYVSDDSHGYNDWNAMPPDDPQFSGVTIWADTEKDRKNVIPFKMPEEIKPVLEITRVRDDEFRSQGLKVKSPVELRLLCLGESTSDEMADGGWIMNAASREVVWDMNRVTLQPGGGAKKNKMFDGTIRLEKGDYIVYYSTDDSHSFGDWNSGPPHEQDYWGITLWATKKEDIAKVEMFDPVKFKNDKVVAEILRVRDDEYRNESFSLDKETRLRIVAIGEGDHNDMADYGWIKNTETGKTVWEMTYRNTENAGGASKNRIYNEAIILPKGSYKVYFETDGSHSYRDWNASPPRDQERYGISIQLE